MHYRIRDLNKNEKPRERLLLHGATTLSDEELLALILGSGGRNLSAVELAREVLKVFNGLNGMVLSSPNDLKAIPYVNDAKACALCALGEIVKRVNFTKITDKTAIKSPQDVYCILKRETLRNQKEHLYVLSLNSRNIMIGKDLVSLGTVNETIVNPRDIFQEALKRNATAIIIAHNHPSENPEPSNEDIRATQKVLQTGRIMGIPLIDHVIVCNAGFVSLKSLGLLRTPDESPNTATETEKHKHINVKENQKGGDKNE